ncbi:DUF4245 domain-containing protein [Streptomyces sp. NRRL B-24484]|uniref:DUF4245 domain-containing protein n=1 Tax=Streptomyces sp. NRRL B-24484 TaxID=1463833 RepID=UPI0006950001|nr:DUF4245 domain-containing protein [Streptomyces sp. NRRL B-24484]
MVHHGRVAGSSSKRGRQTVRDMILSMLAVGVVGFFGYLFIPHEGGDGVHVVDYRSALASAKRAAPYPVLGPQGLSGQWRATSVEYRKDGKGNALWHLGFVTPSGQYAAVEQSNGTRDDVIGTVVPGGRPDGSTPVAGQDWQRFQGTKYRGLTTPVGTATTVVTGSASYDELAQLAAALK